MKKLTVVKSNANTANGRHSEVGAKRNLALGHSVAFTTASFQEE